jgi:hypothetical protein
MSNAIRMDSDAERRHGTCTKCGSEQQTLVLACVREADRFRELNWVCGGCSERIDEAKAAREEAVRRLCEIAASREAREMARRVSEVPL